MTHGGATRVDRDPSYNGWRYLRDFVQSVLDQDYPNIELLVLDNGCTDNTREILSYLSVYDVPEPYAVRVSMDHLMRHPEVVLSYGDHYLMDADCKTLCRSCAPDFNYMEWD